MIKKHKIKWKIERKEKKEEMERMERKERREEGKKRKQVYIFKITPKFPRIRTPLDNNPLPTFFENLKRNTKRCSFYVRPLDGTMCPSLCDVCWAATLALSCHQELLIQFPTYS